ncbi:MAG: hypothetical protein J7539_00095 [Niabella sp.]|nr:hypothetical protein [Niabella sp.]
MKRRNGRRTLLQGCIGLMICFSCVQLNGQMTAPADWVNYDAVFGVKGKQRSYNYDVAVIASNTETNVLWPGEQPAYTIQVVNNLNEPIKAGGKIVLIHYGLKGRPNDIWLPEVIALNDSLSTSITVDINTKGYQDIKITPNVPATFGGYALIVDLGKYGRRLITSVVRSFAANPQRIQYPKQSLDDMGADFLHRIGVQAIRMGIDYTPTTAADYESKMAEIIAKLKKYREKNITVLLMFGAGTAKMPLGMPRSFLDDAGIMRKTKQDYAWLPSEDADFKKFVQRLCTDYGWPKGPVTAVSLWNEPWEGASISGWQSDILRYREIYTKMAEAVLAARQTGAEVLVGGGDSNSNAWDKLFADGKMTFLPIFDFCSIHYQGIEAPSIYPEWVNRKSPYGRVKIWDTESWVGNTDDRIGLTVAVDRSAGYDRSMGIYAGYLSTGGRGSERFRQRVRTASGSMQIDRIPDTWSPSVAVAAVQHLIGERAFDRLLFKKGLPWVMLFDGINKNPDDGTAVICGDIGEAFGAEHVLFRNVRGLKEISEKEKIRQYLATTQVTATQKDSLQNILRTYEPLSDGKMLLPANKHFILFDFYGNPIRPKGSNIEIPLNTQGYYLRTDGSKGSFTALLQAINTARIEGYEPVEIIAKDMTAAVATHPVMELQLTNILNRPIKGKIKVSLGSLKTIVPETISFAAHETKMIPVTITGGAPVANNTYPLAVHIDAGADGFAVLYEDMHVNLISHLTINVDGKLDDWKQAIPQTVSSNGAGTVSLTEAAWYPFKNFDTRSDGFANGYLAYDNQYFYFAAKVADNTPHPGTYRFANRPDDSFFYPDTSYIMNMDKTLLSKEDSVPVKASDSWALERPDANGRSMHYWCSSDVSYAFAVNLDLPENNYTRVSFYLPNIKVPNATIELFDAVTNKFLQRRKIDNLWNGAYETFDLSGKVRVVFRAYNWWTSVKLAGIFFDPSPVAYNKEKAIFISEDLDSKGDWKNKYGKLGYKIIGAEDQLPGNLSIAPVTTEEKIPLVWPEGVRRFTYRRNPVTPDNSGLGFSYDNVLIAFNVIPEGQDGMLANPPGTMPRYIGYKDTDYEYALNSVSDEFGGGTEIWRLLAPGMNRKHFFPRQPKSAGEGPVKNGKLVIKRNGNTLITECAIPWPELPDVKKALDAGKKIKFSFRVNDNGAPGSVMELAKERSVSKLNARAFHPDWKTHWANEVEFSFEK